MLTRKFAFLAGAALALASTAAQAQDKPATAAHEQPQAALADADPALWVVRDDDTTVYLFGTFHMLDGKQDWFNDEVKTAFDSSQELVMEAKLPENMAALQPLILKYALDPSGKTLTTKLPEETNASLHEALTALGAPPNAFDAFEPWFAAMTVTALKIQSLGLNGDHGTETILTAAAKAGNKPVGELEGFEYQLKMLDEIPEKQQITYLTATLADLSQVETLMDDMVGAWSTGDIEKLATLMNDSLDEYPQLHEMLLTRRNANWAEWVDKRLEQPGTVFVAVGAGHLAGGDSVQRLLSARGIESERVTN